MMNEIYEKLIKQYKNIDIKLNNNEEIIISNNKKEIKVYKDGVIYFYKGRSIAHSHDKTNEELYQSIKYYLEKEPNYFIKQHKKDLLIKWVVILGLLLIVVIAKVFTS